MENESSRASSDLGFSQSLGFQDFDCQENNIWCEQCKELKQELKKIQGEQALNYSTLKKKIISTDLLIKKYKGKCDDYEAQSKKYEEFFRKYEDLQRESETLNTQLGSALQQLEPLRKAKAALEIDNKQKEDAVEAMRNRIAGLELSIRQFEEVSKASDTYKERYEMLKRENQKKKQTLETTNQKNEALVSKLRDENKTLKQETAANTRKQKRLEEKVRKVVVKLEIYWGLLKKNGLLPKGEKKPITDKLLDVSGEFSVSQDEEDEDHVSEMESEDESSPESESFPWIFSPVVSALSPLPPSPMPCRANKKLLSNMESDDDNTDEMADMLMNELLSCSPVRTPTRPPSLLKKVQMKSQLAESKQLNKKSTTEIPTKSDQNNSKNSLTNSVVNDESKSHITLGTDSENLSDSDGEEMVGKKCPPTETVKSTAVESLNKSKSESESITQKAKLSSVSDKKQKSQGRENTIDHSEHSMFQKVKPHKIQVSHSEDFTTEPSNTQNTAVKEDVPLTEIKDNVTKKNGGKIDNDKPSNIARKIEFVEKPKSSISSLSGNGEKSKMQTTKSFNSSVKVVDKTEQHFERVENVSQMKDEAQEQLDTAEVPKKSEEPAQVLKTAESAGFDLDDLAYDDNPDLADAENPDNQTISSESCETPSLDFMISLNERPIQSSQDELGPTSKENNSKCNKPDIVVDKLHKKGEQGKAGDSKVINSSEEKSEQTVKPSAMSRQVSSGFVLKSPPVHDLDTLGLTHNPLEPKPRIAHKTNENQKATSNEICKNENTNVNKSDSKESTAKCSLRRISQQGSFGFSIDDDSAFPDGANEKQSREDIRVTDSKKNSAELKSQNILLKEKYLAFIKSRSSSHVNSKDNQIKGSNHVKNSNDSQIKGGNLNTDTVSVPLECSTNNSMEAVKDSKVEIAESGISKKVATKKDRLKCKDVNTVETKTKIDEHLPSNICKSRLKTQRPGESNKKTLHQLVVRALDSKTIPSSAVISPDLPSISKMEDNRPLSRSLISSPAPLSPLSVSPFDFSLPMLISPLPPSPSNWREPVSPLPGSPWVEEDVSETQSERSTPSVLVKKKKSKSKLCSFSSNVPSGAIHVTPITACSIQSSAKLSKEVPSSNDLQSISVPSERDPLAMGKKQRISRVPNQTATKRKSLEPIASEIQDKRKCIVNEKGAASAMDRPLQVKQETGYWKDVDLYLQQYICVYTMTPDDIKNKLSVDKDPTAVLPCVVLWITQYLRNSEAEMVNKMYRFCNDGEETIPGPFMTTQESRITDLCTYIIQNNFLVDFKTKLLDALWNAIMLKEVITTLGRTALCRVFTAVCQKEGNIEYVRVLFYHIIASGYPKFISLGLSIIGVWPQVLYKSDTVHSDLLDTLEFCIMKVLLNDREKFEKVITCYSKLCNWKKPVKMEANDRLRTLLRELQAVTKKDESESAVSDKQFELIRSLELLLCTEDQTFLKVTFNQLCLNQLFQKVKSKNLINGGYSVMYFKSVLGVFASQISRRVDSKSALKTIKKFVSGILKLPMVSMEVQEVIACILLDIAFIAPMPIFAELTEWYQREQKSVSNITKQKLESTRTLLVPYEGKLTTFSFS